ncbi:MAG: signal peptidase I [Proteobacteria bacterium]|nr:signal peptidase I [Pseudomonadota bacterium]
MVSAGNLLSARGEQTVKSGVMLLNRISTFDVQSRAMEPTIKKGTKLAVERFYYANNTLERWHVIFFILSNLETSLIPARLVQTDRNGKRATMVRPHFPYVKRVVGLPGDTIKFTSKEILCDDRALDVPNDISSCYAAFRNFGRYKYGSKAYKVPDDGVFVLSDNLATGIDSRHMGAIPLICVSGRLAF